MFNIGHAGRLLSAFVAISLFAMIVGGAAPAGAADPELAYAAAPDRPAVEILGDVCVLDGDTVSIGAGNDRGQCIGGKIVHLEGIDAPELAQKCRDRFDYIVACGRYARAHLIIKTRGRKVRCTIRPSRQTGHHVGACYVGSTNLNQLMVHHGMAVAVPTPGSAYQSLEARARNGRRGIWALKFISPAAWRRTRT